MAIPSPTGAAARKNPPPASLVAHRSFAIPAATSTSRTTVSRPRTPVATRIPSARQARNATSTPRVSGQANLLAGRIDQEQVAGDHQAIAAHGFDDGHDVAGR